MGMSMAGDAQSLTDLHAAFDCGYRHFDTSDVIGRAQHERLLGRFLSCLGSRRDQVLLASKFGVVSDPGDPSHLTLNGRAASVKAACDASLQRLGVDYIDLYYVHRRDSDTPLEETIGAMADLVKVGKIGAIGLCNVSAQTLQRAHAVHPIRALQGEYSLWMRGMESNLLPLCANLGVTVVAHKALGPVHLHAQPDAVSRLGPTDLRQESDHLARNLELQSRLMQRAHELECTPAQLALAWVLHQYRNLHVLSSSWHPPHLKANFAALDIVIDSVTANLLGQMHDVRGAKVPNHAHAAPQWRQFALI